MSLDGDQEELSSNMKENPVGKFMIALMTFPKLVCASDYVKHMHVMSCWFGLHAVKYLARPLS